MKNESAFWQRCLERGEQLLAPQPRSHAEAYRHELKYLISWADKAELTTRMSSVLKLDPHATNGGYFIRSLSAFIIAATAASSWNERKNLAVTSIKKLHL